MKDVYSNLWIFDMVLPIYFTDNFFNNNQKNVVSTSTALESPNKVGFIMADTDVTVDIESGVTVTVDEGCALIITDGPADAR